MYTKLVIGFLLCVSGGYLQKQIKGECILCNEKKNKNQQKPKTEHKQKFNKLHWRLTIIKAANKQTPYLS